MSNAVMVIILSGYVSTRHIENEFKMKAGLIPLGDGMPKKWEKNLSAEISKP